MKKLILMLTVFCVCESPFGFAQEPAVPAEKEAPPAKDAPGPYRGEISEILDSMGYPELQVVPRASDRLAMETRQESAISHWPIMLSGLTTFVVGLTAKGNERTNMTTKEVTDAGMLANVAMAVGAGWIIGPALLSLHRPYYRGLLSLNRYPGRDERSVLMRERLAEESLESQAHIWSILQDAAVITNVAANVGAAYHSNETGLVTAGIGVILSFLPYMFEDHSVRVYEKHLEYKKKIYTPIKSAGMGYDSLHKSFYPTTYLTWTF